LSRPKGRFHVAFIDLTGVAPIIGFKEYAGGKQEWTTADILSRAGVEMNGEVMGEMLF
jgi:hypothetical protein